MQPQNQTPWPNDNNPPQPPAQDLKPHEWFQPSTYDVHRQATTYGAPPTPQPQPKSKARLIITLVAVLSFGLLAASGVWAYHSLSKPTPESIFETAVDNSLSTSSVTQVITAKDYGSQTVRYDVSNTTEPKVYSEIDANLLGTVFKFQQYGTNKDSYVKYESLGDASTDSLGTYRNAWMQSRQNGTAVAEDNTGTTILFSEVQENLLGDWIFGKFSASDKQKLSDIIKNGQTYKYDPKAVTKEQRDGRDVFVYKISLNQKKLSELNKTVGRMYNLPADLSGKAVQTINESEDTAYTLTIDIATKRLIQTKLTEPDKTNAQIEYTDYDTTQLPGRPTVQADYATFLRNAGS